jgi:tryptophan synthase beta subunit
MISGRVNTSRSPTTRRWRRSSCAARLEGIIPALEPSHALAHVAKIAPDLPSDHLMVMNMCGRGDKDIFTVARASTTNDDLRRSYTTVEPGARRLDDDDDDD